MCAFPNFVTDVEEMSCLTSEGKKKQTMQVRIIYVINYKLLEQVSRESCCRKIT